MLRISAYKTPLRGPGREPSGIARVVFVRSEQLWIAAASGRVAVRVWLEAAEPLDVSLPTLERRPVLTAPGQNLRAYIVAILPCAAGVPGNSKRRSASKVIRIPFANKKTEGGCENYSDGMGHG